MSLCQLLTLSFLSICPHFEVFSGVLSHCLHYKTGHTQGQHADYRRSKFGISSMISVNEVSPSQRRMSLQRLHQAEMFHMIDVICNKRFPIVFINSGICRGDSNMLHASSF